MALEGAIEQLKTGGGMAVAPPPLQLAGLNPPKIDLPPLRSAPDPLSASSAGVPGAQITGTSFHVNTELAGKINQLIADAPPELQPELRAAVTSGYRDMRQQEDAYRNYQQGGGLAAPPGHSQHQMWGGMAVDWNGIENQSPAAKAYLLKAVDSGKYGLEFPLGSQDPWHMQMVGGGGGGGQPNDTDH